MGREVIIELPWPAREVWPNYRQSHHWSAFTKARKTQRELASLLTKAAKPVPQTLRLRANEYGIISPQAIPSEGRVPIHVEFHPPDRRNRDDDGCIGAFKSARDGIADALGIDDKRFKPVYWFMEPCKPGKIIVRIGEPA